MIRIGLALFSALLFRLQPFYKRRHPMRRPTPSTAQINDAVQTGLIPGAVLLIGHDGKVVYHKAYGERALIPKREPMTEDTIFDAASLTKVIATTPCIMKLFEQGKLRLDDPVTKYLPEFQGGQERHHRSQPADPLLGPRARPDSSSQVVWLRNGHSEGA